MLSSDYLGSTTLHQVSCLKEILLCPDCNITRSTSQHTQTHSTRLVALTGEGKRKTSAPSVPLPIQPTTLIKIEDCRSAMSASGTTNNSNTTHHHHHQSTIYDPMKNNSIQTATITTAVQTNDMSPDIATTAHHLYYHSDGNLIQIAPQSSQTGMLETHNMTVSTSPISHRCLSNVNEHSDSEAVENNSMALPDGKSENNCITFFVSRYVEITSKYFLKNTDMTKNVIIIKKLT